MMAMLERHAPVSTYKLGNFSTKVKVIIRIWVFLGDRLFAAKTFIPRYWISSDFLGFLRPDSALSTGYNGFSLK
jgi:hypothetical protein